MSSFVGGDESLGLDGVSVGPGTGWVGSNLGCVVCSCEPFVDPLDLFSPWSFFGVAMLLPSYRFGTRPLSVTFPPDDSDGASGCFSTDSVPGAVGKVGFCELPVPEALPEAAPLEGAVLPGANVLGGLELEDDE
jgi:hypothetical protein